jgi:hypothetical protein
MRNSEIRTPPSPKYFFNICGIGKFSAEALNVKEFGFNIKIIWFKP